MSWQHGQNSGWAGMGDNLYAHPRDTTEVGREFPEASNYQQACILRDFLYLQVSGLADFTNVVKLKDGRIRRRRYREGRPLERAHDAPAETPLTTAADKQAYIATCESLGVKLPMRPLDAVHPAIACSRAEIVAMLQATHPAWKGVGS